MTKSSWGWYRILFVILAVLYICSGCALIMNPAFFAPSMIMMIGWLAIIYGAILLTSYFMEANFKSSFTLITAIILIIIGILIVCNLFEASVALGVVAAIGFLVVGAFKLYQAFFLKDMGVTTWWSVLLLAACNIIIGLIMMFNLKDSGTLITVLIGTNLLVNGVSDLMLGFIGF